MSQVPPTGETICVRTNKVYDWCFKNGTTTFVIPDIRVPNPANIEDVAGIECVIDEATCTETARNQAGGGIAVVTLRKQVTFTLTFVNAQGEIIKVPGKPGDPEAESQTRTRFFDEFVQICAPVGTTINCEITNAECRATLTEVREGNKGTATVEVFLCQSVQSEAEVKVCLPIVDFCVPDVCQQNPKPFLCPPTEHFPPQCSPTDPRFTPPCPPHAG